jgi:hypothetical protein
MVVRGILPRLAVAVAALAFGLAGVAGAAEQPQPTVKVDHGSRGGKTGKRASRGRK